METNLQLTSSLAKTVAFLRSINHVFATKCLFVHNRDKIPEKQKKEKKKQTSYGLGLNYWFSDQVFFLFCLTNKNFLLQFIIYITILYLLLITQYLKVRYQTKLVLNILASLLFFFFFFHSTVRIWNTENPKKNKTVIKTKNKQGRKINVKKEAVSDIKFFLLEN